MIKSLHRPVYVKFVRIFTIFMLRRHFREVIFKGNFNDRGLPVLMIGNHFSWWDGFIANIINIRILKRKIHVMMLEEQLAGRKFLNKAGAYSIKKGGRSVMESLSYTAGLLKDEKNLVVLYPQGEFQSLYRRPVTFEKGIKVIASQVDNPFHLLFYVALPDYFSHKKPALTIYYYEAKSDLARDPGGLEAEFNRFLELSVSKQKPA